MTSCDLEEVQGVYSRHTEAVSPATKKVGLVCPAASPSDSCQPWQVLRGQNLFLTAAASGHLLMPEPQPVQK